MGNLQTIFKRELMSYFSTPLAYIFVVIFLMTNGIFTFDLGGFYLRGQADLLPFFGFHPWLYLFMVPAIAMTLWADERKTGTITLLLSSRSRQCREQCIARAFHQPSRIHVGAPRRLSGH